MKELNIDTLYAALSQLPEYEAPPTIWEHLDQVLETDLILSRSAKDLPLYSPPDAVWDGIAMKIAPQRVIVGRSNIQKYYVLVALFAGCIMAAWWWATHANPDNTEQIVVTQEVLNPGLVAAIRDKEDDAYALVASLCASRAIVCDQPEFRALKSELDELTAAKQRLHTVLGQYGDDSEMTLQLVQIELARTQVLQEIIQMI